MAGLKSFFLLGLTIEKPKAIFIQMNMMFTINMDAYIKKLRHVKQRMLFHHSLLNERNAHIWNPLSFSSSRAFRGEIDPRPMKLGVRWKVDQFDSARFKLRCIACGFVTPQHGCQWFISFGQNEWYHRSIVVMYGYGCSRYHLPKQDFWLSTRKKRTVIDEGKTLRLNFHAAI